MSVSGDRSGGTAPGGVAPGSGAGAGAGAGAERGAPARAVLAQNSRRWLRRSAAGTPARPGGAPSPDEGVPAVGSPPFAPADGLAAVATIARGSGVAPVAPVAPVAEGVDVAAVGAVAPGSLAGGGEPRRRRLRWVGWIRARVIHEDRASKFT